MKYGLSDKQLQEIKEILVLRLHTAIRHHIKEKGQISLFFQMLFNGYCQ
jgi:hypothetical protein